MTRVKVCGLTNAEDARAAVAYGADVLGFIAVTGSPRYVSGSALQAINPAALFVPTVLVVQRPEDARHAYGYYAQFYEDRPGMEWWSSDSWRYIRAFRIKDETSLAEVERYREHQGIAAFLLDTYHKDKLGGSGETFNWDLAVEAKRLTDKPIILAGGLTPENVAEAVAYVRPYAVDVSSGVEAEPGRKDHDKLRRFIRAVREAERKLG